MRHYPGVMPRALFVSICAEEGVPEPAGGRVYDTLDEPNDDGEMIDLSLVHPRVVRESARAAVASVRERLR